MKKTLSIFFLFYVSLSFAQPTSSLTVEKIMRDAKWMGVSPSNIQWDLNSTKLYFNWNPNGVLRDPLYHITPLSHIPQLSSDTLKRSLSRGPFIYSKDRSKVLFERDGDIILANAKTGLESVLVATTETESNPVFNKNESKVIFQKADNLYSISLADGTFSQLTDLTRNRKVNQPSISRQDQWLKQDQLFLFELIRNQERDKKADEAQRRQTEVKRPKEFYIDEKSTVNNISISPDEKYIAFRISTQPESSRSIIVPNYVTGSGYTEDIPGRTKVGAAAPVSKTYIYDRVRDSIYLVSTKEIPGIKNIPEYLKEYPKQFEERSKNNEDRKVTISAPVWNPVGSIAVVNIVSQENKDRWIMKIDMASGMLSLLDHQHDEAWIGGPGIANFAGAPNLNWLDNNSIYFQSEATGYSHIYTVDVNTGNKKQLTSGKYEVLTLRLSNDKKNFYFTANIEHPGITHFYRMPVEGGTPVKLTSMKGGNEVAISPDEKWLAVRYSYTTKPWELYLQENKPGAKAIQITKSTTAEFESYAWREPEMITFKNRHGSDVYAQVMQPAKPDPHRPAVVFVHSNGYLQNVHYNWSYHFREYMFNNLLVDNGYTVINIDYTASSGYGRETRTGIYRHMGGKDLSDLTDGAKLLVTKYGVNPKNIGLYGGSYGGFLTLMAMFTEPEVFSTGAALRSVTDWAHYNPRYTANILNEPFTDEKSYRRSSPIYFAEGLKGNLLMTHGIVDVNVNFQDIVRLSQKLIELGKNNWELAVYPLEDHNFIEPSSWTDQYKRIFKLFETTLKK
ncbi:MAG TPA: prolyl oligopeptidase family serine peptidase [Flavitalea sp.]|nr:prolyl oligopeptidase family serine peptidase [Flavitalea sp.]